MARPETIKITEHVPLEQLDDLLREYGTQLTPAQRCTVERNLCFIRMRYRGYSVEESSASAGISKPTGFSIQKGWNESGFAGLVPGYTGGRKAKLTEAQRSELKEDLEVNPMDTRSVRLWIKERFKIDYSEKQVHVILRKMGLNHAKPYQKDHRRPDDAEAVLKKDSKMLWRP